MDILNKNISTLSFADIQAFCSTRQVEGIQLDYKKDVPSAGLAKHFASFSNSRGGLIIIGVEEDTNGTPKASDGVVFDTKLIDRIHQYASNVAPIPLYKVDHTDEVNGKVFILIRIFEGDRPPYYVHNDANLYVRTGNITSLIDKASPDVTELLFGKKEKAAKLRQTYIVKVNSVYEAALRRAEKERFRAIAEEKEEFKKKSQEEGMPLSNYESRIFKLKVGTSVSMCSVLIQPFAPTFAITSPSELKQSIRDVQVNNGGYYEFPSYNAEPIPQGMMTFEWNHSTGEILTEQLYGTGLVYYARDVLRIVNNNRVIAVASIAAMLFNVLRATNNIYNKFGYQGGIIGKLVITGTQDIYLRPIVPYGWNGFFDHKIALMDEYSWDLDLDSSILNDKSSFEKYFIDIIREIYWDLGFGDVSNDLVKAFLEKDLGWTP